MNKSITEKTIYWLDRYKFYLLGVVYILLFFSHLYHDLIVTVRDSMNFMGSLFTGKLATFYEDFGVLYSFPIYLIMGIWNLPLYLLRLIGIDPLTNTLLLHWSKLQLVATLVLTLYLMKRIADLIGMDKKTTEWCIFLTASSCLVMSPILIQTQYDIITVTFMMIALNCYFKNKMWGFLICFALAGTIKGFSLIVFIPLLLLHEKRILHILWKLIVVVTPSFVLSTLFPITPEAQNLALIMFMLPFRWEIPTSVLPSSVFFILTFILWFYCYQKKPLEGIKKYSVPLYTCFAAMGGFITVVYVHPYWAILAAPFLYLALFLSVKRFRIVLLLESVFTISMTALFQYVFHWCNNFNTIAPTFLPRILRNIPDEMLQRSPRYYLERFVSSSNITIINYVISSAMVASFILLLWFLYPKENNDVSANKDTIAEQMPLLLGRTIVSVFICLVPVAIYLAWVVFR